MNSDLFVVLALLGVCMALFVANKPRMDVVALLAIIALPVLGVLTVPEAFAGLSDPNVVLIAAMFVIGEGLVRTGVANQIGDFLLHHSGESEARLLLLLMLAVAALGSVMSSTAIVAIFIPVVLFVARARKFLPGRFMMPLGFAGLISGMLTLVGTAPNLVVNSSLQQAGFTGLAFFSFTPFGLTILAAGIVYMLVTRRWLNLRQEQEKPRRTLRPWMDFVRDYELAQRDHRVRVGDHSPLIGQTLQQLEPRRNRGASVVAIERVRRRRRELIEPRADLELAAGDVLLVDVPEIDEVRRAEVLAEFDLEPLPLRPGYFTDQSRDIGMAEVLLPPHSGLVGHDVRSLGFRTNYRLNVIGLRRRGDALTTNLLNEKLRVADTLLVIGRWKSIRELQKQKDDFIVLSLPAEIEQVARAAGRAPQALACLGVMLTLMITGWVPNVLAALIGCLLMGLTRCLSLQSAYNAIQWPTLIVIVGMMPFSIALQKTGGVDMAVHWLLQIFGAAEPRLILGVLFALTAVIGLFVSNTATAVLMAPIALKLATALSASPYPFAMTIALACSSAFMTPVSSPVNMLVLEAGRYRFGDFVRIGVPFTMVTMMITILLVPWFLPLHP